MRILLILPFDNTYKYKGSFSKSISYAPLTLAVLAALIPSSLNAEIRTVDEGVEKPVMVGEYDIVAISCVTSSANRAYELAAFWKKKGSYVLLGGPHVTLMPHEAAPHGDSLFIGAGEMSFPAFFSDYTKGIQKKIYHGTEDGTHLPMPIPRRDLISDRYMKIPTVIANRGCSNQCGYCCIHKLWGHKGTTRPIQDVIHEIKGLKTKRIILLDPSPTSDPEYAEAFFKALIPLKIKWSGLSTIDIVKNEKLFSLMVNSGCEGILAGLESFNAKNLIDANKMTNTVSEYKHAVKCLHKENISVLGCVMAGFDHDTRESLLETVEMMDEIGIDLPRYSILTPFPGTKLYEDMDRDGRIITKNWDLYDTMHVVFKPRQMTEEELQSTFFEMWQRSYGFGRILKRVNNLKHERLLKLGANLGFMYYANTLSKAHKNGHRNVQNKE